MLCCSRRIAPYPQGVCTPHDLQAAQSLYTTLAAAATAACLSKRPLEGLPAASSAAPEEAKQHLLLHLVLLQLQAWLRVQQLVLLLFLQQLVLLLLQQQQLVLLQQAL